jgi:hypothetical protein
MKVEKYAMAGNARRLYVVTDSTINLQAYAFLHTGRQLHRPPSFCTSLIAGSLLKGFSCVPAHSTHHHTLRSCLGRLIAPHQLK